MARILPRMSPLSICSCFLSLNAPLEVCGQFHGSLSHFWSCMKTSAQFWLTTAPLCDHNVVLWGEDNWSGCGWCGFVSVAILIQAHRSVHHLRLLSVLLNHKLTNLVAKHSSTFGYAFCFSSSAFMVGRGCFFCVGPHSVTRVSTCLLFTDSPVQCW